jgi:hypothetical protein
MRFAEPVLGLAGGKTRGLNPSYKVAAKDMVSSRAAADCGDGGNRKPGMRPPEAGASVHLLIALFFLFPVLLSLLLFACSARAPFPSLFQWLFLYSAHIGAL